MRIFVENFEKNPKGYQNPSLCVLRCTNSTTKYYPLTYCFRSIPQKAPLWGSRDGAVVRVLAYHQCGPGSIPGPSVICGVSLLLVLILAPRVFSPGSPVFLPPQKSTLLNSNFWSGTVDEEPHCKFPFIFFRLNTLRGNNHIFDPWKIQRAPPFFMGVPPGMLYSIN